MSILTDLKAHLISSISDLKTSNVFIDYAPDSPDNVVILYGYGGVNPELALVHAEQAKKVQIMVRHTKGATANSWLRSIESELYTEGGYKILNNTNRCIIKPLSEITFLKFENNRFHYLINIEIVA